MSQEKDGIVVIPLNKPKFAALCLYPVAILCLGIWLAGYGLSLENSLLSILFLAAGIAVSALALWLFVGVAANFNAATTGFNFTQEGVMFRDQAELSWPPSPPDFFSYKNIERFEVRNTTLTLYLQGRKPGDRDPNIDFKVYRITGDDVSSLLSERMGLPGQNDVTSEKALARLEE